LRRVERKLLQLLCSLPEVVTYAAVILDELRVFQDQVLPHQTLERGRLLVELTAGASGLRRLQDSLLTLRSQAIEAYDQLDERVQERQTDQQETEQDELEE
jgi:hypothetical protein